MQTEDEKLRLAEVSRAGAASSIGVGAVGRGGAAQYVSGTTLPEGSDETHRRAAAVEIASIVAFIREAEKLKSVLRKVKPLGEDRYENSAEHSWQLALLALALRSHAAEPLRIDHVIRMLLVHDLGEIDTGDTMAFVEGGWAERKRDELAAVRRICGLLPAASAAELVALWQEFEGGDTAESRFARAVDRVMPTLLNLANGGQSWKENGISYERVVRRIEGEIRAGSPALWDYLRGELEEARERGLFGAERA